MIGRHRPRGTVTVLPLFAAIALAGTHSAPPAVAQERAAEVDTTVTMPTSEGPEGLVPVGLVREIRERTETLDRREEALAERERSLEELSGEARRLLDDLATRREQVEQRIAALEALQGDGVNRLAKVYGAMPPARAAALLEQLDRDMASALLARIKPKKSAELLAAMTPETALELTRSSVMTLPQPPSDRSPAVSSPAPDSVPAPSARATEEQGDEP